MDYQAQSVAIRTQSGGQIFTGLKADLQNKEDLATFYSPGIAGPCRVIAQDEAQSKVLTQRRNTVAVISDGSAVLGLGNIGAAAALPVMEGKCMLLKAFGGVDGVPIVLDTQNTAEIIETVKRLAPTFGGVNLEDIAAPRCFEIERVLSQELDIPVFHDDQHGTAICTLAALINSLKVVDKKLSDIKVVFSGAGAAGIATAKLFRAYGVQNIVMTDSKGIITTDRENLSREKSLFATEKSGDLAEALVGADIFVGVSKPDILTPDMIETMNDDPVIFAMANPDPEIHPELAKKSGVAVIATGRSDFPNQINNVLVFPGLFRGLLDAGATKVTEETKLIAAQALADLVESPTSDCVIPNAFDERVATSIAKAVGQNSEVDLGL